MRDLLDIMWQRHSCRAAFDPDRGIGEHDMQRLLDAARWSPTAHNMQNFEIIIVDDQRKLGEISAIHLPPSETFQVDESLHLSLSEAESLQQKTGLVAAMFPASWHEPDSKWVAGSGARHTYLGRTINPCAALLIVVYDRRMRNSEGDTLGIMSLGCVMQNLWLMAESLGISMQILSAVGQQKIADRLRHILVIPGNMDIAFAVRLGYPTTASESHFRVRRKIEDFTHRNRYRKRD